jgi:hypothetical protein
VTLVVDLLDDAFATTEDGALLPPAGRQHVPAGFAEFASANDNDGPPAKAKIDLADTPFAFSEAILANGLEYFCAATDDQTPADGGNTVTVSSDLKSFTLDAIDPRGTHATKMVADCAHSLGPGRGDHAGDAAAAIRRPIAERGVPGQHRRGARARTTMIPL